MRSLPPSLPRLSVCPVSEARNPAFCCIFSAISSNCALATLSRRCPDIPITIFSRTDSDAVALALAPRSSRTVTPTACRPPDNPLVWIFTSFALSVRLCPSSVHAYVSGSLSGSFPSAFAITVAPAYTELLSSASVTLGSRFGRRSIVTANAQRPVRPSTSVTVTVTSCAPSVRPVVPNSNDVWSLSTPVPSTAQAYVSASWFASVARTCSRFDSPSVTLICPGSHDAVGATFRLLTLTSTEHVAACCFLSRTSSSTWYVPASNPLLSKLAVPFFAVNFPFAALHAYVNTSLRSVSTALELIVAASPSVTVPGSTLQFSVGGRFTHPAANSITPTLPTRKAVLPSPIFTPPSALEPQVIIDAD